MRDAMKIAKKDKRFSEIKYDETTLRIEHNDWRWGFSPDSLRGLIAPPSRERLSDIIRKCREAEREFKIKVLK